MAYGETVKEKEEKNAQSAWQKHSKNIFITGCWFEEWVFKNSQFHYGEKRINFSEQLVNLC